MIAFAAFLFVFTTFSIEHIADYNYAISKEQSNLEKLANNQQVLTFAACGGVRANTMI